MYCKLTCLQTTYSNLAWATCAKNTNVIHHLLFLGVFASMLVFVYCLCLCFPPSFSAICDIIQSSQEPPLPSPEVKWHLRSLPPQCDYPPVITALSCSKFKSRCLLLSTPLFLEEVCVCLGEGRWGLIHLGVGGGDKFLSNTHSIYSINYFHAKITFNNDVVVLWLSIQTEWSTWRTMMLQLWKGEVSCLL